jgi:hypothetical protein
MLSSRSVDPRCYVNNRRYIGSSGSGWSGSSLARSLRRWRPGSGVLLPCLAPRDVLDAGDPVAQATHRHSAWSWVAGVCCGDQ